MKPCSIGLLGVTGTVGSELIRILCELNVTIYAYVRNLDKVLLKKENIRYCPFDFNQPNFDVFMGIDKLFWITPNQLENIERNKWLKILKNSELKHIVQLSSIHPEVFELNQFEQLIQQSGIPYTILRPNTFMQNFNKYEKYTIENEQTFYCPGGFGKTSFIDIRDIVKAAANILVNGSHLNKICTLTGPQALDYYQVSRILSDACNKKIRYIDTWSYPEFESDKNKSNPIRQTFFEGVRKNLFSEVTEDLENLLGTKSTTFTQYADDYWKHH